MRKRNNYAVLEKKLKELESELNTVIAISRDRPCNELLSESIINRFLFLRKLLKSEVESHTYTDTHHFRHIHQRLDGLETAFHEWDNSKKTTPNNHTDTVSTCSCSIGSEDHEDNEEGGEDGCGSSGIDSPAYEEEEEEENQECVYEGYKEENQEYIFEDNEEENHDNTSEVVTTVEEEDTAETRTAEEEETEEEETGISISKVNMSNNARGPTESRRRLAIFGFIILGTTLAVLMAWLSGFWVYEWDMEPSFLTPT